MSRTIFLLLCLASVCSIAGCGVRSVEGGTRGELHSGESKLADVQITIYESGTATPVATAISNAAGEFNLVAPGATGPHFLQPGEYRFTLESAGSPVQFTADVADPAATTLKFTWTVSGDHLELDVPLQSIRFLPATRG